MNRKFPKRFNRPKRLQIKLKSLKHVPILLLESHLPMHVHGSYSECGVDNIVQQLSPYIRQKYEF